MSKINKTPCLKIFLDPERADDASGILADLHPCAVEQRDGSTLSGGEDGRAVLIAGFDTQEDRDAAAESLREQAWLGAQVEKTEIGDDGWSTAWRAFFQPVVLERLQVLTPWMNPPRRDRLTLVIDPGQAFGTGGHATTKLLLGAMETLAQQGELPEEVLDVGTGSGVLAIAALLLGSKRALGVDIEEESIDAALENADRNGVGGRLEVRLGQASDVKGDFPLVLANIQLAVFEQCALDIARTVAPGGLALLSGLLEGQGNAALGLFPGFALEATLREGEWIALRLRKA
jgi:ribosomal protein L11 methyltransferase